jgi:hypothetical protein
MKAGDTEKVTVTLKNVSSATWPSKASVGTEDYRVRVSYHWLPINGETPIISDGMRTDLLHDIAPGEALTIDDVLVQAPPKPGSYHLQVTLVHEKVAWFENKGAKILDVPVIVR